MFDLQHLFLWRTFYILFKNFFFLASSKWHRRPCQSGSHTKLRGRLASSLSPAEKDNRWLFTHSPKRHLFGPKHSHCPRRQWCHSEREDGRSRGVAGLGPWHSKSHFLYFVGHHWCTLDGAHQAHRTREVVRTPRPPYCVRPGMQAKKWSSSLTSSNIPLQTHSTCNSVFRNLYLTWQTWQIRFLL